MRYICLLSVLAVVLWAGLSAGDSVEKPAIVNDNQGDQSKEIDTSDSGRQPVNVDYGMDQGSEMPQGQVYDQNTGMPDVVPSDREGEIE
jgi:hypothetical protein